MQQEQYREMFEDMMTAMCSIEYITENNMTVGVLNAMVLEDEGTEQKSLIISSTKPMIQKAERKEGLALVISRNGKPIFRREVVGRTYLSKYEVALFAYKDILNMGVRMIEAVHDEEERIKKEITLISRVKGEA